MRRQCSDALELKFENIGQRPYRNKNIQPWPQGPMCTIYPLPLLLNSCTTDGPEVPRPAKESGSWIPSDLTKVTGSSQLAESYFLNPCAGVSSQGLGNSEHETSKLKHINAHAKA